MFPSLAAP
jgi:hypothetical protein